jgi:hypothetical protein
LLTPVTVMLYLPGGVRVVVETVMMEVPFLLAGSTMLDGTKETVGRPATPGETVYERVTVPGKPPRLFRVMVEIPDPPAGKDDGVIGLAEMLKSDRAMMNVTACDTEPLIPVTVKV